MQNNSITSQTDIANVTVVTEENQIIVPQPITSVIEVNNPGPQGPVGPTGPQGPSVPFSNIGGGVYATTSSLQVTGSFLVSGSSTFTNIGPAIFSGSTSLVGATTMSSAIVTGNVTVLGTASIGTLVVNQTVLSTGSNQLGDSANDTQTLYGSVIVPTGSLTVTGSINATSVIKASSLQASGISTLATTFYYGYLTEDNNSNRIYLNANELDFWTNGSSTMRLTKATKNVLIGTTTDVGAKLHISGSTSEALLVASSSAGPALYVSGSGRVGIGTNNPQALLDLYGTSFPQIWVRDNSVTAYLYAAAGAAIVGSVTNHPVCIRTNNNNSVMFWTNNGVSIGGSYINSTAPANGLIVQGNTGIGTNNPTASLHISGASNSGLLTIDSPTSSNIIYVSGSGNVGINTAAPQAKFDILSMTAGTGQLRLGIAGANGWQIGRDNLNTGRLAFIHGTSTELVTFLINGNVGIGTIAPDYPLHITRNSTNNYIQLSGNTSKGIFAEGSGLLAFDTAGNLSIYTGGVNLRATFTSSGSLGIGTSTPSSSLHIGPNTGTLSTGLTFGTGTSGIWLLDNTIMGIKVANADRLWIRTTDFYPDTAMTLGLTNRRWTALYTAQITDTGTNVLIGTTTDAGAKLNVRGSGTTSATRALRVENTNASASLVVLDNGFVGIGTGSAQYNLDVNGSMRVGDAAGSAALYLKGLSGYGQYLYFDNGTGNGLWTMVGGTVFAIDSVSTRILRANANAQVTINGNTNDSSAQFQVESTTRGFLPPRTSATSLISSPAQGLITYVTGSNDGLYYYNSGSQPGWHKMLTNTGSQSITGSLTTTGNIQANGFYTNASNGIGWFSPATAIRISTNDNGANIIANNTPYFSFANQGTSITRTSGTGKWFELASFVDFSPTSGTTTMDWLSIAPTINQTGGANGVTRGLYINPTLTSAPNWRAIETTSGSVIFNSGSVGIGTTTPTALLSITGNASLASISTIQPFNVNDISGRTARALFLGTISQNNTGIYISGTPEGAANIQSFNSSTTAYDRALVLNYYGANVGIGRVSPTALLHISGASSSSSLLQIDSPASSSILFVSGSGFVGVGTNNPVFKLDVSNPSGYSAIGIQTAASTNAELQFKNAAYSLPRWTIRASAAADGVSGNLVFQRFASTFPMTITSGDNVLIGTSTDSARLMVKGSGTTSGTTTLRVENANASASLSVLDNGFTSIGTNTPISLLHMGSGISGFLGDFTTPAITFNTLNNGIYLDSNKISFKAGGAASFSADSNGPLGNGFRINAAAYNDLTTPIFVPYRLTALSSIAGLGGDSSGSVALITSGSTRLYVSSSGNVGIGTITPAFTLDVSGSTRVSDMSILSNSGTATSTLTFFANGNTTNSYGYIRTTFGLSSNFGRIEFGTRYLTSTSTKMTLDENGNLGIGISSSPSKLYISGSTSEALLIASSSAGTALFVSGSGRVGIGTSTPIHPLDVNGTIRSSNTFANAVGMTLQTLSGKAQLYQAGGSDLAYFDGANVINGFTIRGTGHVGIGPDITPSSRLQVRGAGATNATTTFLLQNSTPTNLLSVLDNGQVAFTSPTMSLAVSQSAFSISPIISASNIVGGQYYGVSITPTFFQTTGSQTETAFRVAATFTSSNATATTGSNIIADFGSTSAGSQLTVTDVTSGSIYMVNDVSGIPIIEATSNWDVNMYDFPNKVFEKTGSQVNIYGTMRVSGSFILPLSQSVAPQTGSAYWSGSLLFIYNGTRYMSASFA